MWDDRLQELISAYLDGEVSAEERTQVEQQLADSVECRQFYDQLARQRAALRSLPRQSLQVDLSRRVLEQIERVRPAILPAANPAVELPAVELPIGGRWRRSWRLVAMAIGTVAAMWLLAFYLTGPGRRGLNDGVKIVTSEPPVTPGDLKAPEIEGQDRLTPEILVAVADFQELVKLIMIYDITVTPRAQKSKVVEGWMQKAGIPLVQQIAIDARLEKQILESRFLGKAKVEAAVNGKVGKDKVQMLFVRGTGKQIDGFYQEFAQVRGATNPGVDIQLDIAASPRELEVFLKLNQATGLDLAQMKADPAKLRSTGAFPIQFREPLQSVTQARRASDAAVAAHTNTRKRNVSAGSHAETSLGGEMLLALATPDFAFAPGFIAGQPAPPAPNGGTGWNDPSQALFVIRKLNDEPQ